MTVTRTELGLSPGSVVLDVGCARGLGTDALRRSGCHTIGIEISEKLLQILRAEPQTSDLPAIRADGARMPLADASVDAACAIEVLEHIPDPGPVLHEMRRVVRSNGRVCVAVPTAYTERAYRRLHPRYESNSEHLHCFDRASMISLMEEAGFRVERVDTKNLAPALAWYLHALLRSEADPTGRAREHRWVDLMVHGAIRVLRSIPGLRRIVRRAEARVGKSWYFHGVAT